MEKQLDDERIYQSAEELPPSYRRLAEKLMEKDYLTGSSRGLELSGRMLRLLMILNKTGIFD